MRSFFSLALVCASVVSNVFAVPAISNTPRCGVSFTQKEIQALEMKFALDLAKHEAKKLEERAPISQIHPPVPGSGKRYIDSFGRQSHNTPVWHVIYSSTTWNGGYLSDANIQESIKVLNKDFKGIFIFRLSRITRTLNADWFNNVRKKSAQDKAMKAALRSGPQSTMNVYSVGNPGALGYSTMTDAWAIDRNSDGVVIRWNTVPGGAAPYNLGRTLTHEAGHWVGLYHVFDDNGRCGDADMVADTPAQSTPTFGCPATKDSCAGGGIDSIHNYMDYTDDSCMTGWTAGQVTRMIKQCETYRAIYPTYPNPSPDWLTGPEDPSTNDDPQDTA
ncbi:hypothetical protein FRC17_005120 [Serendipita sp. 399]|nr:hypothetical protein FRC17_005120 [Serendipita sp. 399]